MRIPRAAAPLLALSLVLAIACDGGSGTPTATPEASATELPTPQGTIVPSTVTPAPTATTSPVPTATQSPEATATATPSPQPSPGGGEPGAGDVEGFPFSTVELHAAIEARGFTFRLIEDRPPVCDGASVQVRSFWSANAAGSDSGPLLALWVYADPDRLRDDWSVDAGSAPEPRFACELLTGFVYWNENMVMALVTWLAAGFDVPIGDEAPREHPAVDSFLSLTR